ncbi:MAG TPA: cytidylate kinase-like family protein [Ruminococcus sp.]|nr:cytidylate kinase-like family protein [Ruminococcus sp.]HBN11969.1 cytidylate kinase-like family protein [Ruminococcus sp.]HCR72965.1 cytidylate kinase-like family protein [Ruminococcus sp.]
MKKHKIITIERQYASGGLEIGQKVSELLGIPIYNREILAKAAEKLNVSEEYLESSEESASGSLLMSLSMAMNTMGNIYDNVPLPDKLFFAESEIIRNLADTESCIIVGRCADYILREREDCLRIFIYADNDFRRQRAIQNYNASEKDADGLVRRNDKRRSSFYTFNSGRKWGIKENYHICLNSGKLGIKTCADIIAGVFCEK